MNKELPKSYDAKEVEPRIYKEWDEKGYFNPDNSPTPDGKPFCVTIPPPNVTGQLHMGHALNNTLQDIIIRYHRMLGQPTLWVPGTDHAGIATQNVVEKKLAKQKLHRHDLGREKFLEEVWKWKEKYGNIIIDQLKKLGCSCDWTRERFTMDEGYTKAIYTAFVNYWEKGYIFKGPRIVNWCPRCSSAISDIEIKYQDQKSKLYYIKYPLADNPDKYIIVATTRPETMLGDSAIGVNPSDERYKNLIGKKVILPLLNRKIPIIADTYIEKDFGTGALKITPAHDMADYNLGQKHNLEIIQAINEHGRITKAGGEFAGLKAKDAKEKVIEALRGKGYLEKEEDYDNSISLCDRCGTAIEPLISTQWFVEMKNLAKPAIEVVEKDKVKIIPDKYKKVYLEWMANIKDWCISRQLWWGHRIPVYYCQDCFKELEDKTQAMTVKNTKGMIVSATKPDKCPNCGSTNITQDEDVLDTWFSSALWPFATLGWPDKTADMKKFFPTNFLSTARDILYLWVARMIFSSIEFTKKIPFSDVYIHATVLTLDGRRMSKSMGVIVNPLDLIEKYGADGTRFGLAWQTMGGQDIRFDEADLAMGKKFCNKIYNASRFLMMRIDCEKDNVITLPTANLTPADNTIIAKLNETIKTVTEDIENYRFGQPAHTLYDFFWHDFCDTYIEEAKKQPDEKTNQILLYVLVNSLKLLHPFIPFVTEEVYQNLPIKKDLPLILEKWPLINK